MTIKKVLLALLLIVSIKVVLNFSLKIDYSEENVHEISHFQLNDSILVESGTAFIGENFRGEIEAVLFPDRLIENGQEVAVTSIYIRFYPSWFRENLLPVLSKSEAEPVLFEQVQTIHDKYFGRYSHFNHYPIISKKNVPFVMNRKDGSVQKSYADHVKK
jgi:hypothetical protein